MHRGAGPLPEAILTAVRRAGVVIFVIPARTIPLKGQFKATTAPRCISLHLRRRGKGDGAGLSGGKGDESV